jgi:hypothetical protein
MLKQIAVISSLALIAASSARAESYLNTLGKAYQEQYHEVAKLGKDATPARINEINNRVFAHSSELFIQERKQVEGRYLDLGKQALNKLNEMLKSTGKLAKLLASKGKADSNEKEKPGDKISHLGDTRGPAPVSHGAVSNTGEAAGSDSAKAVQFGGARQKAAPKVVDGIIVDP